MKLSRLITTVPVQSPAVASRDPLNFADVFTEPSFSMELVEGGVLVTHRDRTVLVGLGVVKCADVAPAAVKSARKAGAK